MDKTYIIVIALFFLTSLSVISSLFFPTLNKSKKYLYFNGFLFLVDAGIFVYFKEFFVTMLCFFASISYLSIAKYKDEDEGEKQNDSKKILNFILFLPKFIYQKFFFKNIKIGIYFIVGGSLAVAVLLMWILPKIIGCEYWISSIIGGVTGALLYSYLINRRKKS